MKIKKAFRLDEDIAHKLEKYAKDNGMTQTEAIQAAIQIAIQIAIQEPYASHTPPGSETDWESLYFEEKRQNRELTERLLELTGKVADSLQAAQTLQAMDKPALESVERKKRPWWRFGRG